jgi:hypothetical protein
LTSPNTHSILSPVPANALGIFEFAHKNYKRRGKMSTSGLISIGKLGTIILFAVFEKEIVRAVIISYKEKKFRETKWYGPVAFILLLLIVGFTWDLVTRFPFN